MARALWVWLCCAGVLLGGCALTPPPELRYRIAVEPVLPPGGAYYVDPVDSSVVWSREGLQVKVRFLTDAQLDQRFDPRRSPYTLTGWRPVSRFSRAARLGYTPPLWTAFEVTVFNRTLEGVELDPTQVVLRLDDGRFYYCAEGVGVYQEADHYGNYAYLKWGGREGRVHYYAAYDVAQLRARTQYLREKPVRKGRKYAGLLTFPALPTSARAFTLEINRFILAFDSFEPGYGHPTQFTDLAFRFTVDQGAVEVEDR
ncbi:MAG: hypothetical protein AB1505_25450 [Candidatus Latescibacterota bacterium]